MAIRPGKSFAAPKQRGPGETSKAVGNVVTLHEAVIVCMVRQHKFTMSLRRLVLLNKKYKLYRRQDGDFPGHRQLRGQLGVAEYRHLFAIDGGSHDQARVSLRQIGDAEPMNL
jgi:hypothetical protein